MNLWHDVSIGKNAPDEITAVIEIPRGSNNKYEIEKETGLIYLDRANYSAAAYPADYGFVPQTLWDDGDALDVIVLTAYPLNVGVLVNVRPVGVMEMIDSGESDYKIISVPVNDKRWDDVQELSDVNQHTLKELAHFFETYKVLKSDNVEKNKVVVKGFQGKQAAIQAIEKSIEMYKQRNLK